jgi:hypothetical protein
MLILQVLRCKEENVNMSSYIKDKCPYRNARWTESGTAELSRASVFMEECV